MCALASGQLRHLPPVFGQQITTNRAKPVFRAISFERVLALRRATLPSRDDFSQTGLQLKQRTYRPHFLWLFGFDAE
jgi:hypothetical protein